METVPYDVLDVACPSRMVLARVGEKWTVRILLSLDRSVLRFTELRGLLTDITPKVLTETLRALERDGLVARQVFAEVPTARRVPADPARHVAARRGPGAALVVRDERAADPGGTGAGGRRGSLREIGRPVTAFGQS